MSNERIIAELKWLKHLGYDPYNSTSGREWYTVSITLGISLDMP